LDLDMPAPALTPARTRTLFTVRGTDPVAIEVAGRLDAGAAVGFRAVADWLIGAHDVTFDLTGCPDIEPAGHEAITMASQAITRAGGNVRVRA
jgi:hypothetical protein